MIRSRLGEGASLLAICGGYQLLCHEYVTLDGERISGVGIFDAMTRATSERLTGNVRMSTRWGTVVGFENHAGRTYLGAGAKPLGRVESGHGNNGEDGTEGMVCGRAIGSYLHGPLLPRNPDLADWLLLEAVGRREPRAGFPALSNDWELSTHPRAQVKRPGRAHLRRGPRAVRHLADAGTMLGSPVSADRSPR
jgi:CobQ-like glutamine amidotransferase family enzyme